MRCRRGFTLVEVLVALGLLVLIASLALPVALTNTTSARATTAERVLKLAPNTARGEAQHRGLPVALVLLPSEDGEELRLALIRQPDPESDNARDLAADPDDISTWPTVDDPTPLPRGTALWDGEIEELEAFEAAAEDAEQAGDPLLADAFVEDDADAAPESAIAEPVDPVVLAWFLSDGSAMAGEATVVQLADGRVMRVRVEALTGRLEFTRAPELEDEAEEEAADTDGEADESQDPSEASDEPVEDGEPSGVGEGESRGFEDLEFDELEFDDLSDGFDREAGDGSDEPSDEPTQPDTSGTPGRTNPQPPQPR